MFLSRKKYDDIMSQLWKIRTTISSQKECGESCQMCEHAIGAFDQAVKSFLFAKKSSKQLAATLPLGF